MKDNIYWYRKGPSELNRIVCTMLAETFLFLCVCVCVGAGAFYLVTAPSKSMMKPFFYESIALPVYLPEYFFLKLSIRFLFFLFQIYGSLRSRRTASRSNRGKKGDFQPASTEEPLLRAFCHIPWTFYNGWADLSSLLFFAVHQWWQLGATDP